MVIREYNDAQAYLDDYETNLLENEPVSQLILYNAYQVREGFIKEEILFGVVLDEEELPLIHYCIIPTYNMPIYAENEDKDKIIKASAHLAKYLADKKFSIMGLNAKYEVCQAFASEYKKHIESSFIEKLGMDIMVLRELNDVDLIEGTARFANMDEVKLITEWMIEFQIESRASVINYEDALHNAKKYIEDNRVYIFENAEQEVVSMAIATRKLANGIAISNVFTLEEFRGTGYAASNIFYMCKDILDKGYKFATLFVDKKNLISNRSYEKLGFQIVDDNYDFQLVIS